MKTDFKETVAIVTGAAFGIGRSTALAFAQNGVKVVVADWRENNETLDAIKKMGGEAIFVKCDVSKEEDVQRLVSKTIDTFGRIDFAVNNAGIEGVQKLTQEYTSEEWDKLMNINLKGVWLCMKYQIPQMLKQGKGAIVNIASIAGLVGFPNLSHYVASKHAVNGLTKAIALENTKNGIRINSVCPGVIRTPMVERVLSGPEVENAYKSAIPMNRFGEPEEMAETILFLCSDAASYITGQNIAADGGWTTQ